VFVADPARGAVVVLTPDLELLFVIGEGEMEDDSLQRPISCTVGGDDLLYVADVGNNALFVYALIYP